jgi:membrane protease YdiL (CAAX protease family)
MSDKKCGWALIYVANVLCYLPYAISFSVGAIAAVQLLYGEASPNQELQQREHRPVRLHPVGLVLLCVFPQIVWLVGSHLPVRFNELTSFMLSDRRFYMYPGPLFLLLPIVPIVVKGYLYGFPGRRLAGLFPLRLPGLLALLAVLCMFHAVYYWYDTARNCTFENPWVNIHLGLKSFYYNGLWEELHYRWLLIPLFQGYFRKNMAILLVSLLFTLTHFELMGICLVTRNPLGLLALGGIFLLGLASGHCFYITRSIVPCIALHGFSSGIHPLIGGVGKLLLRAGIGS